MKKALALTALTIVFVALFVAWYVSVYISLELWPYYIEIFTGETPDYIDEM